MFARCVFSFLFLGALAAWSADYTGPTPPQPDLVYLVHADNLVPTEAADAKQEKGDTYSISGTASSARTPLAEPIFIVQSDHLSADSLELYRLSVKSGHREANVSGNRRGGGRALHLQVTKLGRNLYRLEAAEVLENGEYALSPAGSNKVFCFEVY
jgi:hypothetical protein